jgi:hypothetical protein
MIFFPKAFILLIAYVSLKFILTKYLSGVKLDFGNGGNDEYLLIGPFII